MIAAAIHTWLQQKPLEPLSLIVGTFSFSLLINLFAFFVMSLMGASIDQTADLFVYVSTTMKFGVVAVAAAVAFPGLVWLLSRIKREKTQ
jgi:hypothetical protein